MKKIALLGPKSWSLGNINFFLKKYLSSKYDVCIIDWSKSANVKFAVGGFFDVVISDSSIINLEKIGHKINSKTKIMPVFHHDPIELKDSHFDEDLHDSIRKYNVYSVSKKTSKSVSERYGVKCSVLPIGIDDSFWNKRNIKEIKTCGICYRPSRSFYDSYESVKRFGMFDEIRKKSGLNAQIIWGKDIECGSDIYSACDLVICTSVSESLPMPFLECAASKTPFISTDVGIVSDFEEIIKFETVDEACSIIDMFVSNPDFISVYTDSVHRSVVGSLNWSKVVDEFWIPAIENALQ